jgi:hypothetical protein
MTLSKSETILARIATVLASTAGVSGRVFRDRWEALARGEMPAVVIEPQSEDDDILTTTETLTTTLLVSIDILISGQPLSTLADPVRVSVHSLLLADATLRGLVISIYPTGRAWDAVSGEIGVLRCSYAVRYRTSLQSLT